MAFGMAEAKEIAVGVGDGDLGQVLDFRGLIGGLGEYWDSDGREQDAGGERRRLHSGPCWEAGHDLVYRGSLLPSNLMNQGA
jgi:hypothetical protein